MSFLTRWFARELGAERGGGIVRMRLGATAAIGTFFAFVICVSVNWIAFRHYERWDATSQGIFTLSERTKRVLADLEQPVDVYLFLAEGEPSFAELHELLERYRAESPRLRVEVVDPERHPAEYQVIAERLRVNTLVVEGETGETEELADVAAVVVSGDKRWKISRDDLLGLDFDSLGEESGPKIDVKAEQALTGAIVEVTAGRTTKVCVASGHGEWGIEAGGDSSLRALREDLERDNVEMEPLPTRGARRVPEGCDAVFVVAPKTAFSEEECSLLEGYVRGGGSLLIAVGPEIEGERIAESGLGPLGRALGFRLDQAIVLELDSRRLLSNNPLDAFLAGVSATHPTTSTIARLEGHVLMAEISRPVRPEGDSAVTVLETSSSAYGESTLAELGGDREPQRDDADVSPPVSIAVALEVLPPGEQPDEHAHEDEQHEGPRGGRVFVIGNHAWLSEPALLAPQFANGDLSRAVVGWLTQREALIAIAPKQVAAEPMTITADDLTGLMFRVLVLLPAAFIAAGFAVWWSRRS